LSEPLIGQRLRLVGVHGGEQLRRRLLALGLSVGDEVEVVHRRGGGVVVARSGNRVALGKGVAQKVLAEVIE
jgi:Fe2+ transport system protein FeoA